LATPNSSHCDFAVRAARHGLHALVEKPLATTVADAEKMIAAANSANVCLMTAYRLHNDPATVRVGELISAGAIGDARFFSSTFSFQINPDNHRLKASHWGGPLQDLGVYCLNAARHVFRDNPLRVSATRSFGHEDARFKDVEEGIAVTMEFSKARLAQFYVGFGTELRDQYQITGTKGSIILDDACRFATTRKLTVQTDKPVVENFPDTDNFSGMISYFADCVQKGARPLADGNEGLSDMIALAGIVQAADEGRPVTLPKGPDFRASYDKSMARSFPPTQKRLLV
jgi:predicted dehydrogenase